MSLIQTYSTSLMTPEREALLKDAGLLISRLTFGGLMLGLHGWDKLVNFGEKSGGFPDPLGLANIFGDAASTISLGLAVFAEFFCALLVVLGLGTRLALPALIVTMLVAAFLVKGWPLSEKELPLLYLLPYIALFIAGPGRFSLDAVIRKKMAGG